MLPSSLLSKDESSSRSISLESISAIAPTTIAALRVSLMVFSGVVIEFILIEDCQRACQGGAIHPLPDSMPPDLLRDYAAPRNRCGRMPPNLVLYRWWFVLFSCD